MCVGFQLTSLVFVGIISICYLQLTWFPSGAKQTCSTQIFAILSRHEMQNSRILIIMSLFCFSKCRILIIMSLFCFSKCRILIIMILFCFSLRLSSVLPGNARVLDQDVVLSGYRIPAKASRSR